MAFFEAFLSALLVSVLSLIGIGFLFFRKKNIQLLIFLLVAFAAGTLIGDAFFHIIPESFELFDPMLVSLLIVFGFLIFFVIEKTIHWHHCHDEESEGHKHHISSLNLIGDAVHNFLDGILIGVSYLASIPLGITTTIAIIAHEIPQELGDFGVLLHSGMSKRKALLFNLLSALFAVIGVVIVFLKFFPIGAVNYFLPIVAGGFLYIGMSDLVPELHKENKSWQSWASFAFLILGLAFMYFLKFFFD